MNIKGVIFAFSLLLFAVPAHAQQHANANGGGSPTSALSYAGGGTAGSGSGGSVGFGFSFLRPTSPARFRIVSAQGSRTYEPSTFVSYKEAVEMGIAAMTRKPKTIVEVAAEYRAQKARKN
ncbi:MAG TPA: hypothetical protein VGR81_11905 [Candidatus Acidoferrales bacterium]|nr:hypothetical protein [Candidatus Acidoferrales bacterium]